MVNLSGRASCFAEDVGCANLVFRSVGAFWDNWAWDLDVDILDEIIQVFFCFFEPSIVSTFGVFAEPIGDVVMQYVIASSSQS